MSEAPSCPREETSVPSCSLGILYRACVHNDPSQLQAMLDVGVSPEEAAYMDRNGRVRYPQGLPRAGVCVWGEEHHLFIP
jgi:hypothetical protein